MGASGSKTARQTVRKFPSRPPGSSPATAAGPATRAAARPGPALGPALGPAPGPTPDSQQRPRPQASYAKDDAIRADSMDPDRPDLISPDFADRLRKMGVVQPNPTFSPSSIASPFPDASSGFRPSVSSPRFPPAASNPTLGALEARRRLEARAKEELENMGKSTDEGREFLDVATVKQILQLRQRGASASDIETRLRLKPGIVARLGPPGIVAPVS